MSVVHTVCRPSSEYRSERAAFAMWSLDEQSRKLFDDTHALSPADLEWQPAPGTNTIGMLLAHIAVAEVHITSVALAGLPDSDVRSVIGIGMEEEGLPLADGAPPSPALAGRPIAWFHDLLAKARAHTQRVVRGLGDDDLTREIPRPRPDGGTRILDGGWALYHLLEHEAGHHFQINQLRHLRRVLAR
jgi:uncharacterized damage-inducible protein DinB